MNDSQRIDQLEGLIRQTRVIKTRYENEIQRQIEAKVREIHVEAGALIWELQHVLRLLLLTLAPQKLCPELSADLASGKEGRSLESLKPMSPGSLISLLETLSQPEAAPQQSTPQPEPSKDTSSPSPSPPSPTPEPERGDAESDSSTATKKAGPSKPRGSLSTYGVAQLPDQE
jgi:hypothetical protein